MQERRDLSVLLAACFVVLLVVGVIVVSVVLGPTDALRRMPAVAGLAFCGTLGFFLLLAVVAYLDGRARRNVAREAERLGHTIRRLHGEDADTRR